MTYSSVYQRLTADPSDAIGVFAYVIYKQQKMEFCKSFGSREPRLPLAKVCCTAKLNPVTWIFRKNWRR